MAKKQLINQYDDFCTNCRFKSFSVAPDDHLWCSEHDEFMDIERLKKCGVFCDKSKRVFRKKERKE